jgi:hypothetical protein
LSRRRERERRGKKKEVKMNKLEFRALFSFPFFPRIKSTYQDEALKTMVSEMERERKRVVEMKSEIKGGAGMLRVN